MNELHYIGCKDRLDGDFLQDQREDLFFSQLSRPFLFFQTMEVGGANRHRAAAKWGDIPGVPVCFNLP